MSAAPIRAQRGLSVVEALVGLTVGLVVVGGALRLFVDNLDATRRLLLGARLNQDLRATADVISRDLRRAGHWAHAASGVWLADGTAQAANPHAAIGATTGGIAYAYDRSATQIYHAGFRLTDGRVQLRTAADTWQDVTDPGVVRITRLDVVPTPREVNLLSRCAVAACPAGGGSCPPRLVIRRYDVVLQGRAVSDATVVREMRETVRVRNDELLGSCPTP